MAEVAQRCLELMVVEYEEMLRTNIFSADESKIILKRRKEYEYKIRSNDIESYKEYIEYELCVYRLIKARRRKHQIGEKKSSIEYKILNRIKRLYERAIILSAEDVELYFAYFTFCKETHYVTPNMDVCTTMLKCHKNNEQVWLVAARFYLHTRKEYQYAIKLLLQGLNLHPQSKPLYRECIQYEVMNVSPSSIKQDKDDNKEKYESLNARLQTYFVEMIKHIDDPQYYIDILKWMEAYDCTLPTHIFVIDNVMKEKFSSSETIWDYFAQRERRGLICGQARSTAKILNCIQKYEEGLKVISNENRPALWSLYLDCLIDIKNEEFHAGNIKKKQILKDAFSKASLEQCLPENCYISWIELVDDNEAYTILKRAIEQIPTSIDLWKLRLRYELMRDIKTDITKVFEDGVGALQDDALPLWPIMYQYHLLSSNALEIEDFFKKSMKQHHTIAHNFKPKYIEWIVLQRGINEGRKIYFDLVHKTPYCKEMYLTMNRLESTQLAPNFKDWQKINELGCEQFGNDSIDVWLNYIQYYFYYKVGDVDCQYKAMEICARAKKALPDYLYLDFEERYNLLIKDFED